MNGIDIQIKVSLSKADSGYIETREVYKNGSLVIKETCLAEFHMIYRSDPITSFIDYVSLHDPVKKTNNRRGYFSYLLESIEFHIAKFFFKYRNLKV